MKQNVKIVTFATHEEGTLNDLVHNPYNVPVKVLGFGEKWTGFKMKFEYVYAYMQNLPENDIVVFLDGFDSEIKGNVDDALSIFTKNDYKVLVSVEKYSNLFGIENLIFSRCNNKTYFANSGLYMGYVKYLKPILKKCIESSCKDDQYVLNNLCDDFPYITLDTKEVIFQNLKHSTQHFGQQSYNGAVFVSHPGSPSLKRIYRCLIEYPQFLLPYIFLIYIIICFFLFKIKKKTHKFASLLFVSLLFIVWLFNADYSCYAEVNYLKPLKQLFNMN